MIITTHRVTPPASPASGHRKDGQQRPESEGMKSAVRVLRLCNSRLAHVAFEPVPWRRK